VFTSFVSQQTLTCLKKMTNAHSYFPDQIYKIAVSSSPFGFEVYTLCSLLGLVMERKVNFYIYEE